MAGHGGGAWKVAYADFVTAMMAFFLVMWIVTQNNAVKQAVAQYFQDPYANSSNPSGGPPNMPQNNSGGPPGPSIIASKKPGSALGVDKRRMNNRWTSGAGSGEKKATLFAVHDGNRRFMGTMITFAEGSAALDDAAKERLMPMIDDLRGKPQKIEIRGHATRNPSSKENSGMDPWQLSYARSLATMKFLEQNGIDPERIRLSQGGPYEPYSLQSDPSMQTNNSRVELYVLNEYAESLKGTSGERADRYTKPEEEK